VNIESALAPGAQPNARVESATAQRWPDVETVFGTRGDAARCWCQWFIDYGDSTANRDTFRQEFERATPPGVVAYRGDEPVGWLRVGPLGVLPRLARTFARPQDGAVTATDENTWVASCFVVRVGHRRQGVATALLRQGIAFARASGAHTLLGRPVDAASLGCRASGAELYTGPLALFLAEGFTEIARASPHRPVVRLSLV
jgi:ribosomal protein S18 acetylase RimI-like enzyme